MNVQSMYLPEMYTVCINHERIEYVLTMNVQSRYLPEMYRVGIYLKGIEYVFT